MKKLILIMFLISLAASLASCGIGRRLRYEHGNKYETGKFRDLKGIRNLDVEWVSGSVRVVTGTVPGISAEETSDKMIPSDLVMRYWVDGDTLRIRFGKDGARLKNNFQKDLIITVPEKAVFGETKIDTVSAGIIYPEISTGSLHMSSVSGEMEAEGCSEKIRMESVSGGVRAEFSGYDTAQIETVSGDIDCHMLTEGSIRLDSVSGEIRVLVNGLPDVAAETVSGSVTVSMEKKTGFTAEISTSSGEVTSDFPVDQNGDKYVCGNGSGMIKVSTTSGDIYLKTK